MCYYKQLKAKEQECERLKEEAIKRSKELIRIRKDRQECQKMNRNLHKQLDQLKAENEELKKTIDDLLHKPEIQDKILWKIDNEALLGSKDAWIYKLEQTLQEIKEIAEETSQAKFRNNACIGCAFLNDKILQKISEVEDGTSN
jgi:predicted RNase H-like nuclease (RuvC/YqgF family)